MTRILFAVLLLAAAQAAPHAWAAPDAGAPLTWDSTVDALYWLASLVAL